MTKQYTTIAGDMWDVIAFKVYGDETKMDALMKHNPQYRAVNVFSAGVVLALPDEEPETPASLPPWKRGVLP